ncbi:MAG: Trk system potassium transporter TrkA [Oscillospiraceae bacterium]|nr:Trk system potassium transporter TrkA [Oscillospiraceae bacterium]
MKVVIIGNGKVGQTIAQRLSQEKHDVVIIDNNRATLQTTINELDVIGVCGNGVSHSAQLEAGVENAQLVIAATSSDELNMLCCLIARKLGAESTIARVRDPDYVNQAMFLRQELGLSMAINPEQMTALEIARLLRFPSADQIDTFADGRMELIEFTLPEDSPVNGVSLMKLPEAVGARVLVCAVQRGDEIFIPDGQFILRSSDVISVTGEFVELEKFFRALGIYKSGSRSVMIIGGGKIAYYLAQELQSNRINVKIIEQDRERCLELSENFPNATVICGNGTNIDLLMEEGVARVDAFVSVTNLDEENMIMSMFAAKAGVPKVIAKINNPVLSKLVLESGVGIGTALSPRYITADVIVRYSRAIANSQGIDEIKTLHKLLDDRVEAIEFTASDAFSGLNTPLKDLTLRKNLRIASIVRNDRLIVPGGMTTVSEGDSVIVVTASGAVLNSLNDILA